MKKAVFLDIDGTILDLFNGIKDIRPKVKELIRQVQSRGDYVFIATGRPYAFLNKELLEFGFDGFILSNGAHVIINEETVYSKPIDNKFINKLLSNLETKNIQYILQGEKYSYIKENHQDLYDAYENIGIPSKYLERSFDEKELEIYKIEMLCTDEKLSKHCIDFISEHEGYDYFTSVNDTHLELYFKENTKAKGILKAIEHLDISIENTYAFGDGKNDIEMLSVVGCGIAMDNAHEEVKKYANEITDSVHNDGVAVGIEKFIL